MDPINWNMIPWRFKMKYTVLKEISLNSEIKIDSYFDYNDSNVANGIMYGISTTHLASYAASAFNALLKCYPSYCAKHFQPILYDALLKKEITLCQKNIFKYIIVIILNEDAEMISNLLDCLFQLPMDIQPIYTVIKLLNLIEKTKIEIEYQSHVDEMRNRYFEAALYFNDESIRLAAFSCLSYEVSHYKLNLITDFLYNNVSSENTAFRNEIMKEITVLIMSLQSYFVKSFKELKLENCDLVANFFDALMEFILENLSETKYQNRRFSLLLLDIILRYFEGNANFENKSKGLLSKNTKPENLKQIKNYALMKNKWRYNSSSLLDALVLCLFDHNSDIHSLSQSLIKSYFLANVYNHLPYIEMDSVNQLLRGYFYEIECGVVFYELLLICPETTCEENFINKSLLSYLIKSTQQFKCDIINGLKSENTYYGIILLLTKFIHMLTEANIELLLNIINETTDLFLNSMVQNDTANIQLISPSFADIAQALTSLLDSDEEELFSDEFLFVLNSIWLNIKVGCEFISAIILKCNNAQKVRCLNLLQSVMQRTRHKGICESVGKALYLTVQALTSDKNLSNQQLVDNSVTSIMDEVFLNKKYQSYTRRSAGLCIMLNKIVSGDRRPAKPTLSAILNCLFKILNMEKTTDITKEAIFDGKDDARVTALHCIRPFIHNMNLWDSIKMYALQIFKICFVALSSKDWILRNAGLQIYGVLIPKLVGQKNENSIEKIHESIINFFPFVLEILESNSANNIIEILYFLSRTCVTVIPENDFSLLLLKIKNNVFNFIAHSNCKIRQLAAHAYANLHLLHEISNEINKLFVSVMHCFNANTVHGYLILLKCFVNRLKLDGLHVISETIIISRNNIVQLSKKIKNSPYFLKLAFEEIHFDDLLTEIDFRSSEISVGYGEWLLCNFDKTVSSDINKGLSIFLTWIYGNVPFCWVFRAVESLYEKDYSKIKDDNLLKKLISACVIYCLKCDMYLSLKIQDFIVKIILDSRGTLFQITDIEENIIFSALNEKKIIMPLNCFLFVNLPKQKRTDFEYCIFNEIKLLCKQDDCRLHAAQSLLLLTKYSQIKNLLTEELVARIFRLFQDPDVEIRNTMSKVVLELEITTNKPKDSLQVHPYKSVQNFVTCISNIMPSKKFIKSLIYLLLEIDNSHIENKEKNNLNPFEQTEIIIEDTYQRNLLLNKLKCENIDPCELIECQKWFLENYLENEKYQQKLKKTYKIVNQSRSTSVFIIRDLLKIDF